MNSGRSSQRKADLTGPAEAPLTVTDQLNQDLAEVESAELGWNRATENRAEDLLRCVFRTGHCATCGQTFVRCQTVESYLCL